MIRLTQNDWRLFHRLQRKHKVSTEFLRYNLENIEKFIWYETWPRIVIKRYAIRKNNRVFIIYNRLRRVLFDQCNRKMFKRMRQNIKQWSKRMVIYLKTHVGIEEYIEEVVCEERMNRAHKVDKEIVNSCNSSNDVSKQLKEQLELLKNGRRPQPLIATTGPKEMQSIRNRKSSDNEEIGENTIEDSGKRKSDSHNIDDVRDKLREQLNSLKAKRVTVNIVRPESLNDKDDKLGAYSANENRRKWQMNLESTPEKQVTMQENIQPTKVLGTDEKTEKSQTEYDVTSSQQTEKVKTGLNFLDMLMSKVNGSSTSNNHTSNNNNNNNNKTAEKAKESLSRMLSSTSPKQVYQHHQEHSMDSTDGFLGFDDCERIPGMLMTPVVPHSTKNKNCVFVSESLNEYMRLNDLETNYSIDEDKSVIRSKIFARDMEGLMTPKTLPPPFDMPAVPENLLKFRTVAERKQYLQKFSKNYRLAIINNEAIIYRELQRRMRTQKVKSASQQLAQSPNSSMSFTRNGWKVASFINTEFNKYYYQILDVDNGLYMVRLRGARGNNGEFRKTPYISRVIKPPIECPENCADDKIWQDIKPIKTVVTKTKKLNKGPLPSVFKPCPLSHKTFQKPLDDDTAALLLAGGSMAVVRMPTVELEVFPEYGKPLHEIAKRYLQYILPHHDISREWAEFSVSTLLQPKSVKEAEQAVAKSLNSPDKKKSYTFVIPYLNDRNHILVRRVVDRSEKLDQSFETCLEEKELVPKTDFSFRQNIDENDKELLICADVVSDMINTVAISCSENSFIKNDPDGVNVDEDINNSIRQTKLDGNGLERLTSSSPNAATILGNAKKQKKQNSLLLELKRLNATIIDAAVKTGNDKKPCSKSYCQMGCICGSLAENLPMREHCGKSKCILECNCKSSNQSRIMRLETDGRTITTEDAFMLRRKATARLARMEKEFTSTVVLTENETLLINETNNDKKRRCTKAPKRYEDFTDTEDEQRKNLPKKAALTTIDNEKNLAVEIKELREPVYVKDSILNQLKHCTVNLVPLQNMDNIASWCMIHNLYKCFCKGRAVEGKPVVIEKEEINTTIQHDAEQTLELDYSVSVKPKYTFDKVEKRKKSIVYENDDDKPGEEDQDYDGNEKEKEQNENDNDDWIKDSKRKKKDHKEKIIEKAVEKAKSENNINQAKSDDKTRKDEYQKKSVKKSTIETSKPKPSLHEVRRRFFESRTDSCRRQIPIPRRMFLYCNRKRRFNVLKFIKDNENEQTRLLLNEHVMRSVYYHKIDSEIHKKSDSNHIKEKLEEDVVKTNSEVTRSPLLSDPLSQSENTNKKYLLVNEVVDLLEDDEEEMGDNEETSNSKTFINDNDENSQLTSSSTRSCTSFENLLPKSELSESTNQPQSLTSNKVITVRQFASISVSNSDQSEKPTTNSQNESAVVATPENSVDELKLPKIASCFSLNVSANLQKSSQTSVNEEQNVDFTSATSVHSAPFSQNQNDQTKHLTNSTSVSGSKSKEDGNTVVLEIENENVKDVYNNVIKTMNSLVSKKMQDIDCALQRESHIIPAPNADILCIMKWANFLDAFCEGFAYIWQVKMKDVTFFVVTIRNMMPLIAGAMGIVNITALKPDKMPLMGKMLLQRFRNKETEKLAVVMQGKLSHWVVKGFLRSDPTLACNKPTPESHPSLTKKINVLCSLLVKQRQRDQKKKEKLPGQWPSPQMAISTQSKLKAQQTVTPQVTPKVAQIMPIRRVTTMQQAPTSSPTQFQCTPLLTQQPQQPIAQTSTPEIRPQNYMDMTSKSMNVNNGEGDKLNSKNNSRKRKVDTASSNNLLKMETYSKMSTNIEFRSVNQTDINEIFLPELHKLDHKWLVLDLHNDFSHIFVPDFRDLVSLDRIQKVINFARQKNKIVKLQFFQNAPFDAFVTPKSGKKIYFGPLTMDMKAPTLILLQSVDGQMMLRELYQLQHNIVKKPEEKTKAFWLINLKGQTHFEMDVTVNNEKSVDELLKTSSTSTTTTACKDDDIIVNCETAKDVGNSNENDDDEDCMIIDDSVQNVDENTSKELQDRYNFIIKTNINDATVSITPQSISLPGPPPIQTLQASKGNSTDKLIIPTSAQSLLKVPNTNTIIKPLNPSNTCAPIIFNVPPMTVANTPLPILTLPPNTVITGIKPTPITNVVTSQMNFATNAVITGIKPAPPDASYSSTIFITSSLPSSSSQASVVTTMTSAATINNATLIPSLTESHLATMEQKSDNKKKEMNMGRQTFEPESIKRRRISLFCSNKYDKISENLAVDAVINNILPNNDEYIQINPLTMLEEDNTTKITQDLIGTVGSTKVTKHTDNTNTLNTRTESENASTTEKSNVPIVFDVNFMDDGDEPTASIVIKPSTSTTTNQTSSTLTLTQSRKTPVSDNVAMATSTVTSANTIDLSNNVTTTTTAIKSIKLPTLVNTPAAISNTITTVSGEEKPINTLLCTTQQKVIMPKFSTLKNIKPKLPIPSTFSNTVTTATATCITSSADISTMTSFPFRSSVSLNLQKVVSSTGGVTFQPGKSITTAPTTTTTIDNATSQQFSSTTLTVEQMQAMLNKPGINMISTNSETPVTTPMPLPTMPLQFSPTIKATIAPVKVSASCGAIRTLASTLTSSSSISIPSSLSSTSIVKSASSSSTTNILNSALTISKVQSFGSSQKPQNSNSEKNVKSIIPSQEKIIINDINNRILAPPAHIQYGYIVSTTYVNQKFVAKRVAEEFYVKVPSVGILKLQGLGAVNIYLNKYVSKTLKVTQITPAVWQFVAASKAVQMQNHQKSLLVRKTKAPIGSLGATKNIKPNTSKSTVIHSSLNEPILIDD